MCKTVVSPPRPPRLRESPITPPSPHLTLEPPMGKLGGLTQTSAPSAHDWLGLVHHRGVFPVACRHRLVVLAAPGHDDRLLPRRAQPKLVRRRLLPARVEHRLRAHRRPRRQRRHERHGDGALGAARVDHADARLGVRAVLLPLGRVHDAGVPRAPLRQPVAVDVVDRLARRLHLHQGLGHGLRRRGSVHDAVARHLRLAGKRVLDRGADDGRPDRHLHRPRRSSRRGLHGGRADRAAALRLGLHHHLRPAAARRLG